MRKYVNKPMEELAAELSAGLLRLRKGYVDAAEVGRTPGQVVRFSLD